MDYGSVISTGGFVKPEPIFSYLLFWIGNSKFGLETSKS
jgi:hypothetical protein